jgi:ABC-type branched-subunit amino acid transport system substrate-binding protein
VRASSDLPRATGAVAAPPQHGTTARALAAAGAALLLLGACDAPGGGFPWAGEPIASPPLEGNALIVGFVGTLSGPGSWRGEDAFEGADVAVQVLNRARPAGALPYELRPLDDEGDARTATQLLEQLAQLDRTVGIVYAGPPTGLPPAEPALARARIPAVLCYGDLATAELRRPHLFQASPALAPQARRIGSYLAGDRGYRTVGALVQRSPAGRGVRAVLEDALARRARLVAVAYQDRDLGRALERLRRRRVEAVVVQGSPAAFADALAWLRKRGSSYRTTAAARIASAPAPVRRRRRSGTWRPQPVGFDLAISPRIRRAPAGTVAADSYARGAHYLPVDAMRRFRRAFGAWWDARPLGWEARAFDAASMIGWAARRAEPGDDLATVLEGLSGARFSGLPVSLSSADHLSIDGSTVGLWAVPHPGARVAERSRRPRSFRSLPWVPLARSFAGRRSVRHVLPGDRRALFAPGAPPDFGRLRFGVTTSRSDPVH